MNFRLMQGIIVTSLAAFGVETVALAHEGAMGHALPGAVHSWSVPTGSSATSSTGAVISWSVICDFGNAITESVYPNVPDSAVLKNDGQTVPTPPKAGPKA